MFLAGWQMSSIQNEIKLATMDYSLGTGNLEAMVDAHFEMLYTILRPWRDRVHVRRPAQPWGLWRYSSPYTTCRSTGRSSNPRPPS